MDLTVMYISVLQTLISVILCYQRDRLFKKFSLPSSTDIQTYSVLYTGSSTLACSRDCIHRNGCKSFVIKTNGECRLYDNAFLTGSNTDPDFTYYIRHGEDKTCVNAIGYEYYGYLATTRNNTPCLRWDTAAVSHPDANFIDGSAFLAENFCREPTLHDVFPWCYTNGTNWEYCTIGFCCLATVVGYSGNISRTVGGLTCQRWDSQSPHNHSGYYTESVHQNYCRNTWDMLGLTWCYTVNPGIRYEVCGVRQCGY